MKTVIREQGKLGKYFNEILIKRAQERNWRIMRLGRNSRREPIKGIWRKRKIPVKEFRNKNSLEQNGIDQKTSI